MQKTNFKFEVLIHDDASTDKTADIIREYENKYPEVIKPIYQTENQYSKGIDILKTYQIPRAKGKYIAICEGDDYWCDENKLQMAVDYLENNQGCGICTHSVEMFDDKTGEILRLYPFADVKITEDLDCEEYLRLYSKYNYFLHTSSYVIRKQILIDYYNTEPLFCKVSDAGDDPLLLWVVLQSKIGYLPYIMSRYRKNYTTGWSYLLRANMERGLEHHYAKLRMFEEFNNFSDHKYDKNVDVIINKLARNGYDFCASNNFPKDNKIFFRSRMNTINKFKCVLVDMKYLIKRHFPWLVKIKHKLKDK